MPVNTVTPEFYGAVGDGIADDTAALAEAGTYGIVILSPGKTYKITSSLSVPKLLNYGGFIDIGASATLTGLPTGDPSMPCFKGTGKFVSSTNYYSVAWFDGSFLDEMWDFCRRGFVENSRKTVVWPMPLSNVPAYHDRGVWKLNNPIQLDGNENNSIHLRHSAFFGVRYEMPAMIEYSASAKTEDVSWPFGIDLDCGSNALHGILAHGGSRMYHGGKNRIMRPIRDGVRIYMDVPAAADCSEPQFEFLEVTKFGQNAVSIYGNRDRAALSAKFSKIFSNGARALWGKAVVDANKSLTSFTLTTNGPSSTIALQDKAGHLNNEVVFIAGSNGHSAKGTITTDIHGFATGVVITSGGENFNANEWIFATVADAYVKIVGTTRDCRIDDFYEYQDNNSNLCPPALALAILEATDDGNANAVAKGASQRLQLGALRSYSGRRPALITGKTPNQAPQTPALEMHSFSLDDFSVPSATYNTQAYLQYSHISGGATKVSLEQNTTDPVLRLDSTVNNYDFYGISLTRVVAGPAPAVFGSRVRFDGRYACRASVPNGGVIQLPLPPSMNGTIEFICESENNAWATTVARSSGVLYLVAKGSAAIIAAGALTGATTTYGMHVSLAGGIIYLENRTNVARDFVILANV